MKKLFTLITLSLIMAVAVSAQDYKAFRVGLGLGYALGSGSGSSGGVLIAVEPSYRLSDNLSLGLRWETAAITRGSTGTISPTTTIDVAAIGSFTLNGQYYLGGGESSFRPFVGAGLGLFSLAAVNVNSSGTVGTAAVAESTFGFYPRAGFDLGHFNITLDYNIIPSTAVVGTTDKVSNSYFGFRIGAYIGGGKK